MFARRILYFTAEDQFLYSSARGRLRLEARFPGDELGVAAFREHLQGRRGAVFSVVADLTGEDFHEEQIPFLRGADREAVVQRRLAQRYRDTRLATALSLGQVANGERRNERLLLASFTNTQQLAPWLEALDDSAVRLAGVYSVPLLAPALAARLGARLDRESRRRCLVVTANRAGLRQSFVEDGRLRFARLERAGEMLPQALAMFVRSETMRLAQYLVTLRALPRDGAPVHVLVVAPHGHKSVFEQALSSDARLAFHTFDAAEAAAKVGLSFPAEAGGSEALYVHLAARKAPQEQFASREDRRRYAVWQLQRGVLAAGALGFAACGLYASMIAVEAHSTRELAAAQAREARAAAGEYERITSTFPVTQTSTENLKIAVLEFERVAKRTASPESAFAHISNVMEKFPQVEIERIDWSVGAPGERAERPQPTVSASASPSASAPAAVRVKIAGRVNATQRSDYRGITAQVQRFADALASSGYVVELAQLPFDITSEGTLTGDMVGAADSGEAPRFTLLLLRRLP